MIVCICNNVSESDLEKDPGLQIGNKCGKCMLKVKTEKECIGCKNTFPIENFYTNGTRTNADGSKTQRYKPRCKSCENTASKERHWENVLMALSETGRALECERCGYDKHRAAIEFHHIDPNKKDLEISKVKNKSYDRLLAEIEKCEVLCSNCHRVEHAA